jgi:hypothetical protein
MPARELSTHSMTELDTLVGSSVDSAADYYPVYDASAGKVVRVLAGAGAFGDPAVNVTASTLVVTRALHARKIVTLNRAGGIAVTLPAATGTGETYKFIIGTTYTSAGTFTAAGSDKIGGHAWVVSDGAAAVLGYNADAAATTIVTLDGTTQGGYVGHEVTFTDIASGLWQVKSMGKATGSEASPFS